VQWRLGVYLLAKVMAMALVGVTLKPCRPAIATEDCVSDSNSTNANPGLASTIRTCDAAHSVSVCE
jgi:hypothetical protein